MPCFVLTHRDATTLVKGKTSFTFVTEGPERALTLAQAAAGDKAVNVMGANAIQQFLRRGLINEIHLNLLPVLLQAGTPCSSTWVLSASSSSEHERIRRRQASPT